jgi:transcriptional regulator with AAA-type ATPase domain
VSDETTHELSTTLRGDRLRMLVLWEGSSVSRLLPHDGLILLGRSKECDVVVEHPSISRKHVEIAIRDGNVHVRDLGSANGTRVGGRPNVAGEEVPLAPGTLVEIGIAVVVLQHHSDEIARDVDPAPPSIGASLPGVAVPPDGPMRQVFRIVEHVAKSRLSVLLLGETGVGKEVLAEVIHRASPRAGGPFVRVNCAALAENLVESELFGHEKGAFTGALQTKRGLVEAAHGGTLFIDEVGELAAATQVKLLRVVESREVQRVGALAPRPVDVRFVAATHRELEADVRAGKFREDLYYRLNGVSIAIPPLRARVAEVEPLARLFAARASQEAGRPAVPISGAAMDALRRHSWPGNVRELRNVVERAVVFASGGEIRPEHLGLGEPRPSSPEVNALPTEIAAIERTRIERALEEHAGNQSRAAKALGISRSTLLRRMDEYGMPRPRKE